MLYRLIHSNQTKPQSKASFTSAQTAYANFSESLTKIQSYKSSNSMGYHEGAWKNILLL